jgi:hypothetical protein
MVGVTPFASDCGLKLQHASEFACSQSGYVSLKEYRESCAARHTGCVILLKITGLPMKRLPANLLAALWIASALVSGGLLAIATL